MLKELHIENIAVIEKADIEFGSGLNVLSGETGAGKSIIIDSINAVMGARTGRELVRSGTESGSVSACFDAAPGIAWLDENEIEYDSEIIIRRKISADGKGSCRINGVPATTAQLRDLCSCLIDIHGQNDGRKLLDERSHLSYLDAYASIDGELAEYAEAWKTYSDLRRTLSSFNVDEEEKARQMDILNFRIGELEAAAVYSGERGEIEGKLEILRNFEKLSESLNIALQSLSEDDSSALNQAQNSLFYLNRATAYAPQFEDACKELDSAIFGISDAVERIRDFLEDMDFSPDEYNRLESRLSSITKLERKYNRESDSFPEYLESMHAKLDSIMFSDEEKSRLEKELKLSGDRCLALAKKLSMLRRNAAERLDAEVTGQLHDLNMKSAVFRTEFEENSSFDRNGIDTVRFLLAANSGEGPGRLSKVASGGEMSRVLLAMKNVFASHDPVPTMIFDEIDTGVSGIAAQRVGEKLFNVSSGKQVLCVTHLPQIAALADFHFRIEKNESEGRTYTSVTPLNFKGRCEEIARMYGGDNITALTLESAREQISAAENYKAAVTAERRLIL